MNIQEQRYQEGLGIKKDEVEAVKWLRKPAIRVIS